MVADMMDNFISIILKDSDIIFGLMVDNIKDTGKIIKCMEKDYLHGLMEENIKVNMLMIKNKEKEYSHGLMEEVIMAIGKMENKMDKASIKTKTPILNKVSGKKEKKLNGSIKNELLNLTSI